MEITFPVGSVYVYDGMAIVRGTPSEKTWGDFRSVLLKRVTPKAEYQPLKVHIVFDNYTDDQVYSVKASKRTDRGDGRRLHIGNDLQDMPQGNEYQDFLRNSLNKAELIKHFNEYMKSEVRSQLKWPLTLETETWEISSTGVNHLFDSNHEEVDSRLIHHCILDNRPVVVIATDSDILRCMIYAFSLLLPDNDWFLQASLEKLVNISKIHEHFGREICLIISSFFVLTGCATVSFFFRKTKKAVSQRVLKIPDLAVILLTD